MPICCIAEIEDEVEIIASINIVVARVVLKRTGVRQLIGKGC